MDRYALLLNSYMIRDQATLVLAALAALCMACFPLLDKLPDTYPLKTLMIKVYSGSVLAAFIAILSICVYLGGKP